MPPPRGVPGPGRCLVLGGCLVPGGAWSRGVPGLGGYLVLGGCLVPGGASSQGVTGGVPGGDPPGRLLLRPVLILLECILVFIMVTYEKIVLSTVRIFNPKHN